MPTIDWSTAIRLPLRILPDALHTRVVAAIFNGVAGASPAAARLTELEGRSLCIHVRDAGARWHFRFQHGRLVANGNGPSLVEIQGNLNDFLALATASADPDTLFFQRRLCIEGDTEAGLHVKNLLDALRYEPASPVLALPIALLRFLAQRLSGAK